MKIFKFRISALSLLFALSLCACGAGINPIEGSNGSGNGNQNPVTLAAPVVTQVPNSRATLTWPPVDGAENYQSSKDGAGFATITPNPCSQGTCTLTVPGLSTNASHSVEIRAIQGSNNASDATSVTIDTTFKVAPYSPPVPGNEDANFGAIIVTNDINGDGYQDLAVAGRYRSDFPTTGQVDIFFTGPNFIDANRNISVSKFIFGTVGDAHGAALSFGKVTGNAQGDLVIGQYTDATDYGKIFVFKASTLNAGTSFDSNTQRDFVIASDPDAAFARAEFGRSLAVTKLNGDGCGDIVTGAPQWVDVIASPFYLEGKVYRIGGCISSDVSATAANEIYTGTVGEAHAGAGVWNVGDINEDGVDDVLYNKTLVNGPPASATLAFVGGADLATFANDGDTGMMAFALGKIDGDNYNDFAVRFETLDAFFNRGGFVYIYRGSASGPVATPLEIFDPLQRGFGTGVAFGDIDADGQGELVIGSQTAVSIYEGPDFEDGVDATLPYGCESVQIMDANADGYLDLVCGDVAYDPDGDGLTDGALLVLF